MPQLTDGPDEVDVLIVGAGLSGISTAVHLQAEHPDRTYTIFEARAALGGTWDQFRYPGVRSDSDLQTFGFSFKPWTGHKSLADGASILEYLHEAVDENGIGSRIQLNRRVVSADWRSDDAVWVVQYRDTATGADASRDRTIRCRWLATATGFFDQSQGYTPDFPGRDSYRGTFVHPQHWPADLDVQGRRVTIIGSGATAVTLLPALVDRGAEVVMLQRSPTYIVPYPDVDRTANLLRRILGDRRGHAVTRVRNSWLQSFSYRFSRRFPTLVRRAIRTIQTFYLPRGFDFSHLTPTYSPWDQRLCVVPNGDFFTSLREGDASIVTDTISTFDETGILLDSGRHIDADIIVSATGFIVTILGGIALSIDGEPYSPADAVAFRGHMMSDLPNFSFVIGYVTNSWTLKSDLVARHLCRVLSYMDEIGADAVVPRVPDGLGRQPFLDFGAGYLRRSGVHMQQQGDREPWLYSMSYGEDVDRLIKRPVGCPDLEVLRTGTRASAE